MKYIFLLLSFVSDISFAAPVASTISVQGRCTIEKKHSTKSFRFKSSQSEKLVLGYIGEDDGRYKISVANNGGNAFENINGAVLIGFARDQEVTNPPEVPFFSARTDDFDVFPNTDGDVSAEIIFPGSGSVDPDNFTLSKVVIPANDVTAQAPVSVTTPVVSFGGVKAFCVVQALRN